MKRVCVNEIGDPLPRFHRRKAVAPLKRASQGVSEFLSYLRFPSPKGGGPIEAGHMQGRAEPVQEFPSPKGGGPIEAGISARLAGGSISGFHRRKAVAPLKLSVVEGVMGLFDGVSIVERRWPQ